MSGGTGKGRLRERARGAYALKNKMLLFQGCCGKISTWRVKAGGWGRRAYLGPWL